jgi:hypothetical protein
MTFFHFTAPQTLSGIGEIVFPSSSTGAILSVNNYATRALTIAPGVKIHGGNGRLYIGGGYAAPGLVNQGIIDADTGGATILIDGETFRNEGLLRASAGTLSANFPFKSAGTIAVTGTGKISVTGTLFIEADGRIQADLDSFDPLTSLGPIDSASLSLDTGTFLDLTGGVPGETYTLISTSQSIFGAFGTITQGYTVDYTDNSVRVTVVPEPTSLLAGITCFALVCLRRRGNCSRA